MILLPILALIDAPSSGKSDIADKSYYVAGKFYRTLKLHLACDFIRRDSKIVKSSIEILSVDSKSEIPTVDVLLKSSEDTPVAPGKYSGLVLFSLPISSAIRIDLPLLENSQYNQRFFSLVDTGDGGLSGKPIYVASIGGTKEDITSVEATGFCLVDAVEGDLAKDASK